MDDQPLEPRRLPIPLLTDQSKEEQPSTDDFGFFHRSGLRYNKFTIGFGALCIVLGSYTTAVWNISKYDFQRNGIETRVESLNADLSAANTRLGTVRGAQVDQANQITNLTYRVAGLEASLSSANNTLQQIRDSNGRLEERVKFLVDQVQGRMPVDTGTRLKK